MKLPKLFVKDKDLEAKIQDSLNKADGDAPGSINEEELTDKVCKYLGMPLDIRYYDYRKRITAQVHDMNYRSYKHLKEIDRRIREFEKDLEISNVPLSWLSDDYSENSYKRAKAELRYFMVKSVVNSYSSVVNYLPSKAAKFFFSRGDLYMFPSKWETFGVASYFAVLAGEAVAVSPLGVGWAALFAGSALASGAFYILSSFDGFDKDYDKNEVIRKDLEFLGEYRKIRNKKRIIDELRQEKFQLTEFIKDYIRYQ